MLKECNVLASQMAEITTESKGRLPQPGRDPAPRSASDLYEAQVALAQAQAVARFAIETRPDTDWIVVMDSHEMAQVCQRVVSYDGVDIYRPVPGKRFENSDDAVAMVGHLRKARK